MANAIPFLGRLHRYEYLALLLSFTLALLEVFARTVTLLLPTPIIRFLYRMSRNAFNSLSSPYSRRARQRKKSVSSPIAQASDFVELVELYGYSAEEHIVQTGDGYLLGLHRLAYRRGEEDVRVNAGEGSVQKKVVYLHHGLMMNSEVWVCITEKERCLPFLLVDQGYDVWLGNNRGNKYSKKCTHHSPADNAFWDFSMDQFAFHDIPDSIDYILSTTNQPSLSYIGFSQGTAQAFATLSIHPTLNSKVDVFVALAPAMAPPGLASGIVSSLVKTNPEILFLLFGRRAMLGSATMWSALLYPGIFAWCIDKSLSFLFNWKMRNITPHQKLAAYPHLYSFTSTKSVVHWFQIIRNGTFQMFDDEVSTPLSLSQGSKYYKVAKFPTRNIRTPIVLIYGGSDSLVDINLMLKELPRHTVAREVRKYEHLDLLWASDVDQLVFPHVLEALQWYVAPSDTKSSALGWQQALPSPLNGSQPPGYSEDERTRVGQSAYATIAQARGVARAARGRMDRLDMTLGDLERPGTAEEQLDESDYEDDGTVPESFALTPTPRERLRAREAGVRSIALEGAALGGLPVDAIRHSGEPFQSRGQQNAVRQTPVLSNAASALRSRSVDTTVLAEAEQNHIRRVLTPSRARQRLSISRLSLDAENVHRATSAATGTLKRKVADQQGSRDDHRREQQEAKHQSPPGTNPPAPRSVSGVSSSTVVRPEARDYGASRTAVSPSTQAQRESQALSEDTATVVGTATAFDEETRPKAIGPEGWWSSTSVSSLEAASGVNTSESSRDASRIPLAS
ncbi:cholesterol esterase [Vermiconidia calcicola]|uniref:Cholesterol esterase n=1 Tax=Vermiconidia calcicola TaxID=1690605 RepID=A0ACC3NNK3_9PEZI|nr:cholesterol esterase [Vermiconidia calcicola]